MSAVKNERRSLWVHCSLDLMNDMLEVAAALDSSIYLCTLTVSIMVIIGACGYHKEVRKQESRTINGSSQKKQPHVNRPTHLARRYIFGAMIVLPPFLLITYTLGEVATARQRIELRKTISSITTTKTVVVVNGEVSTNASALLNALVRIGPRISHRGGSYEQFRVEVRTAKENVVLYLAQDRVYHNEYWVFVSEKGRVAPYDIGCIVVDAESEKAILPQGLMRPKGTQTN